MQEAFFIWFIGLLVEYAYLTNYPINVFIFWRIYYEYNIYDFAEVVVYLGIGDGGASG
jgi:hypothetical protein